MFSKLSKLKLPFSLGKSVPKVTFSEGASFNRQDEWSGFSEKKKSTLRRTLLDYDHDGVPDKYDCEPFNPFAHSHRKKNFAKDKIWNPHTHTWDRVDLNVQYEIKEEPKPTFHIKKKFRQIGNEIINKIPPLMHKGRIVPVTGVIEKIHAQPFDPFAVKKTPGVITSKPIEPSATRKPYRPQITRIPVPVDVEKWKQQKEEGTRMFDDWKAEQEKRRQEEQARRIVEDKQRAAQRLEREALEQKLAEQRRLEFQEQQKQLEAQRILDEQRAEEEHQKEIQRVQEEKKLKAKEYYKEHKPELNEYMKEYQARRKIEKVNNEIVESMYTHDEPSFYRDTQKTEKLWEKQRRKPAPGSDDDILNDMFGGEKT